MLITLVIIGVIAAITVPTLITKYQRQQLKSQFKSSVSIIYQVIDKIKASEGPNIYNDYAPNAYSFAPVFRKYILGSNVFDAHWSNVRTTHVTLTKTEIPQGYDIYHYMTQLNNGATVMFWNTGYSDLCYQLYVIVDINGVNKKPNRLGYDTFGFQICPDNSITPPYIFSSANHRFKNNCRSAFHLCDFNVNNPYNGLACTQKAMQDENYFDNLP